MTQREVILEGGLPWGFRMHGGDDLKTPLKISRVNPGSKAAQRGIREGDLITSINGQNTKNLTNNEAHNLLKNSSSTLKLGLNEGIQGSPNKKQYRTIHQETHQETVRRTSLSYSVKETIETSSSRKENNNEFVQNRDTKQNGSDIRVVTNIPVSQNSTPSSSSTSTPSTLVPEGRNISSDYALASRQSSYSNCSSIPDEGLEQDSRGYQDWENEEMNDGGGQMSKSKKRRQRRKNSQLNKNTLEENQGTSEGIQGDPFGGKEEKDEIFLNKNSTEGKKQNIIEIKEVVQENSLKSTGEPSKKSEETSYKNIQILKLKRIEHKYKVESPKEIKIEHIKSSDKRLKAKSKSLDDDDLLKIQELSEASESEEIKSQSNVIISEASSEENLLDDSACDSQLKKRNTLESISLQLNDNNKIEAVSHISPEEEQALRNFLGGLNLIESPEESAKNLYEISAGKADPKAKKQQKRKELEKYFLPIVENPRFLDAISEEASDISDKETSSSNKSIHRIKQCTPEQDQGHVPPPVPPKTNKSNVLDKYMNQIEQSRAVLVETKIFEPENVQETVCTTQVVPSGEQTAEVVYLVDSSESSRSSGDYEQAFEEFQQSNAEQDVKEGPKVGCENKTGSNLVEDGQNKDTLAIQDQTIPQNLDKTCVDLESSISRSSHTNNFHVESNESSSTTILSHTSSSTKAERFLNDSTSSITKVDSAVLSQLTPPPTPDDVITMNGSNGYTKLTNHVLFDYTKIPNVLCSKEPEDGCKELKRGSVENDKSNIHSEIGDSRRGQNASLGGMEKCVKDSEIKTDIIKTNIGNENINVQKTEVRNLAEVHMKKNTVNGQVDNVEIIKVNVNEFSKNGDVEIKSDFEEFKSNQCGAKKPGKDPGEIKNEYCEIKNKNDKKLLTPDIKNDNVKGHLKDIHLQNVNLNETYKHEDIHLRKDFEEDHSGKPQREINGDIKGIVNESIDNEVTVDSKQIREETMTSENKVNNHTSFKNKNNNAILCNGDSKNHFCHDQMVNTNKDERNIFISKQNISEKSSNTTQTNIQGTIAESDFLKESINESFLRHVIMASTDSNKTDSQKLKDFNNIRKINCELREKISRKELIGPAFKEFNSFGDINEGIDCAVVMRCEELPEKAFVQRRVKEFSAETQKIEKQINDKSILQYFLMQNGTGSKSAEAESNKSFIKSKVSTCSSEKEQSVSTDEKVKDSVLKRIIFPNEANGKFKEEKEDKSEENKNPVDVKQAQNMEEIIPIVVENQNETNIQENVKKETIIPIAIENTKSKTKIKNKTEEIIIPITLEKTKAGENEEININKMYKENSESLENIVLNKMDESETKQILLEKQDLVKSRIRTFSSEENQNVLEKEENKNIEKIIPIVVEYQNETNIQENVKKETIIPIAIENTESKTNIKNKTGDIIIPITLEKTKAGEIEEININKMYKENSKSLENIVLNKMGESETKQVLLEKQDLVKSRIRTFSSEENQSVLKKGENKNIFINDIEKKNEKLAESENTKRQEKNQQKETIIPLTVEKEIDNKTIQESIGNTKMIPVKIEGNKNKSKNANRSKGKIIPISLENICANEDKEQVIINNIHKGPPNALELNALDEMDKFETKETSSESQNLVKSRIKTFSSRETDEENIKSLPDLNADKNNIRLTKQENKVNERNIPIKIEQNTHKETVIPIIIEKQNSDKKSQEELKTKNNTCLKECNNKTVQEKIIPIIIEKTNIEERDEKIIEENIESSLDLDANKNNVRLTKQQENEVNEKNISIKIEENRPKETVIPIIIEKQNGAKKEQEELKTLKECNNKTVLEKIIPISIENTKMEEHDTKINLNKTYKEISKSLETLPSNKTEENNKNDENIPVYIEYTKNANERKAEKPHEVKEKVVPIKIETSAKINNTNSTVFSSTGDLTNITKKELKEINESLKNIALSNTENQRKKNEGPLSIPVDEIQKENKQKQQKTNSKETHTETANKDTINAPVEKPTSATKPNQESPPIPPPPSILIKEIEKENKQKQSEKNTEEKYTGTSNTDTINAAVEITKSTQESPPIPPPRRSKNILTKKIYENINMPLKYTPENNSTKTDTTEATTLTHLKENIPLNTDITYTNILSPPRPASAGSDSSDSEESSRCTAKYNPNSSIGDVTTLTKEEENAGDKQLYEPMSLRNIVLNVLMSLPFGQEILRELAEVSKRLDYFTNKIPFKGFSTLISDQHNDILARKEENMPGPWYTQKDVYRNEYGDERHKILELHEKFLTRRKYGEGENTHIGNSDNDRVVITGTGSREVDVMSPNRLLTIIREEPSEPENPNEYIYFEDNSDQRLKAKNLGEWLTLARHKSKSTSNLDCTNIPINNLRKTFTNAQPEHARFSNIRRRSLPQEIYEKQLIDIMEKEREIQRELEKLEDEKRKLRAEIAPSRENKFQVDDFFVSKKGDFAEIRENVETKERPRSMPVFPTEFFRQQMYDEYMDKFSEREERKQQKVIKISSSNDLDMESPNILKSKETIHPIEIEQEFMDKVKEKLGKNLEIIENQPSKPTSKYHSDDSSKQQFLEGKKSDEPPVIVLDGDKVKGIETLPKHLQEFVDDLTTQQEESIWSPGQQRYTQTSSSKSNQRIDSQNSQSQGDEPISPIWKPKSANSSPTVERKEFRAVSFQSPVLSRKNRTNSETIRTPDSTSSEPPWKLPEGSSDSAIHLSSTFGRKLTTSQSSPGFGSFPTSPRLPKAQNPTITLLQKAREGQLPRGAHYIEQDRRPPNDRPPIKYPGEILYHIKNEYTSESDNERPRKMADLAPRKFEGIGPTSKDGMPLILRSEVKDKDQSKWYKRMYDTIHKQKPHRDEFVTVRYKQKRAQYPYTSGYLSEPEPGAYDSDFTEYKYQTLDRRRMPQTQNYISNSSTMPRNVPDKSYSSSDIIRNTQDKYQPGRIENYMPGRSSISEKEAKKWWDEVMDIFDGHLEQQSRVPSQKPKSFINQALKESGYESDSTLVFRRKEDTANQISPKEQRQAYKIIQKGGDVPFQGLRKPAPERPKEPDLPPPPPPPKSQGGVRSQDPESPRKYVENEVTIHYKTPVRTEIKEYVSEDELAHRQAEAMKKIYEEERKRKYLQVSKSLQELHDMKSRRHTDNFIPSQKSPISLNRYDDFDELNAPTKLRPRLPEPRLVARALYNFVGQTARELTFRKGDLIYVRRQVDKNWYEGELNAMVGLFPVNYVEIVPYEGAKTTPRKAHEGQARAKYNFVAQTHLELSLAKGELVTITRRVDDNWYEGKIGGKKGIFPVAYVDVLIDPSDPPPPSTKPVAAPAAHSLLLNGSAQGKDSMGSHLYTPNIPNPIASRDTGYHHAKPVQLTGSGTYSTLPKSSDSPIDQALHIETQSDPVPYRALYRYTPQNDDELELFEGDTVFVLEKCDDGWYVGSSDRTGAFGTFPGNYVEKI